MTKLLLTGVMLSCMTSFGQVASGSLAGTILDSAGSAVPNAKIVATNTATNSVTETQSSGAGVYLLPALQPGVYTITVEKQGFKKVIRQNIQILVGVRLDMDLSLEIGDVSVSVDVTADAPLLETSTSERGATFAPKLMNDLPLFTGGIRNPRTFLSYMPGVTSGAGEQSVSGSGGRAQEVLIDGGSLTIPESGGTVFNMPAMEMFSEFRLVQSTYSAEYGRFGGGVEMYTTKSGGAWFHGAAFLNLRRDIWNANTWARNAQGTRADGTAIAPRLKDRFNETGGNIGGPIWIPKVYNKDRNKSFFFFTYSKDIRPVSITGVVVSTVATQAMKTGNFAGLSTIYDPLTTNGTSRDPFPNNQIPTSRFSKVASNILPLIPNPTRGTPTANFDFVNTQVFERAIWSLKFDHNFTVGNRVAFFMTRENQVSEDSIALPGPLGQGLQQFQKPYNYRVNHDWTIRPTFLMHTTVGFSAQRQIWHNPLQTGVASKVGVPGLPAAADATPRIIFGPQTGGNQAGRNAYTFFGVQDGKVDNGGQDNDTWMITQGYSWLKGKHEFKFGWDHRRLRTLGFDNAGSNGRYYFNTAQTALPTALSTTGNEFASFLLGATDGADATILPGLFDPIRYYYTGGYFQDNWRVNKKLTLNLGFRYEVPIGWHIPAGFTYFDPTMPNSAAGGRPGSLRYAGTGAGKSGDIRPYPTDYSDVGPRLGFAYQLFSKTVIRGGWGIYYQTLGNGGCGCRDGFAIGVSSLQGDGLNPVSSLDNGIPPSASYRPPPNLDPNQLNFTGNASYFSPTFGTAARIQNWSFNIQHEVKKFLIDVAYQGNRGSRLASSIDLNQLPTSELAKGSLLTAPINSPQAAAANITAPFAGFGTRSVNQALRPFPQYFSIFARNAGVGKSWYDALQTKIERRYGGWLIMANHTWSKSLGLAHFRQIFTQTGTATPQDYYNISDSKSYMPFDQTQILNIVTTYDLPFGTGKKYLHSNKWLNKAVGGWTVSGIARYTSGNLIQIVTPGNPLSVIFAGVTKANLTGQPISTGIDRTSLDPNNPNSRWFNANAFAAAPQFTLGTSAFYTDAFRNPPVLNENIGIIKRTTLWQNDKNPIVLTYRADAFNAFNRTSFGSVTGAIGNPNFGRPTGPQVGARLITMGLRLEF